MHSVAHIRKDYSQKSLLESDADPDPIKQFSKWWEEALEAKIEEPNAMTLATASADGIPSARIVLLKNFDQEGFSFYTNYNSYKGIQLEENPKACLVFFWKELERQVRITGLVKKTDAAASETYFHLRPPESQLGSSVSPQSQVIESRDWLLNQYNQMQKESNGKKIDRPAHWGGYIVRPVTIEFWQGQPGRLHDRLQYSLTDHGGWKMERLAP